MTMTDLDLTNYPSLTTTIEQEGLVYPDRNLREVHEHTVTTCFTHWSAPSFPWKRLGAETRRRWVEVIDDLHAAEIARASLSVGGRAKAEEFLRYGPGSENNIFADMEVGIDAVIRYTTRVRDAINSTRA